MQVPTAGELDDAFDQILAQPEYVRVSESVLSRGLGWLMEQIRAILDWIFPDGMELAPSEWVLRLVLVAAFITAVIAALRLLRGRPQPPKRPGTATRQPASRDPADWVRWAREKRAAGLHREAATGLYQAALLQLDSRELLIYREWKTPGDYADEVSTEDAVGQRFLEFLRDFLSVAFGAAEASSEAVADLEARVTALDVRA